MQVRIGKQRRATTILLTNERQNIGRRRHTLSDQHQKDRHRQQRRNSHGNLFPRITRDVEAQQSDERYQKAR